MERLVSRRPPWFWWILGLILASCFTILCWSLCIAIFNHPEVPKNYQILKKIDRLPVLKSYTSQNAPKHSTAQPQQLRNSYVDFTDDELAQVNRSLLHSYLVNFREHTFCNYIEGTYKVLDARKLTKDDIIADGFVVQLQAYTQADEYSDFLPYPLIVELIIPTPYPDSYKGYHKGDMIELEITPHFASLLHLEKQTRTDDDTIIIATAVSLAAKLRPPHEGPFDLTPPKELNLEASFPMFEVK